MCYEWMVKVVPPSPTVDEKQEVKHIKVKSGKVYVTNLDLPPAEYSINRRGRKAQEERDTSTTSTTGTTRR